MSASFSLKPVKKTQVISAVIGGITMIARIKWVSDTQEYIVDVKKSGNLIYPRDGAYFTGDYNDALGTALAMIDSLAIGYIRKEKNINAGSGWLLA